MKLIIFAFVCCISALLFTVVPICLNNTAGSFVAIFYLSVSFCTWYWVDRFIWYYLQLRKKND